MHENVAAVPATHLEVANDIVARAFTQQQSRYLTLCSLCLLVWDIMITIGQEIEHIWCSRPHFTFVKVMYHLNRIWVPVSFAFRVYRYFAIHPSAEICVDLGTFVLWSTPINMLIIHAALATRVWALYDQRRGVLFFLVFLVGGSAIVSSTLIGLGMKTVRAPVKPTKTQTSVVTNCNSVSARPPPNISSMYYCTLIVEAVLFLMMIFQVIRHNRSWAKTPLMRFIGRSGTIFFFLAMVGILFAIIGSHVAAIDAPTRNSNFITAILSINCSRLILSIRDACKFRLPGRFHPTTEMGIPRFAPAYGNDPEIQIDITANMDDHELEDHVVKEAPAS